jgi:hypothetical protein
MSCHDIKELTVPYLELDLEPSRVRDITAHLEGCAGCRAEMEAVRQVLVRLKGVTVPDPGERFWREFPDRVRRDVARERMGRHDVMPLRMPAAASRMWPAKWGWPMALAASLLLVVGAWSLNGLFQDEMSPATPGQASAPSAGAQKSEPSVQTAAAELPHVTDAEWQQFWDDYHDMVLVEMASQLDRRTVDRLFAGI